MQLVLIVNASASSVTPRARVVIQKALSADHAVHVAETSRRGHATRLAIGAAADGCDVVVVLGGDGTVNEAVNGLAGSATALGVLPGGSTNVFARSIGMTNDPIEATGELLAALGAGRIRPIGLGQVNSRYFCFHAGLGYDAAVVAAVEKRAAAKRLLGGAAFVTAALSTWAGGYRTASAPRFEARGVAGPSGKPLVDGRFAICLNTSPYTYLGSRPVDLVPGTDLGMGLSLAWFRSIAPPTILRAAVAAVRAGRSGGPLRHNRAVEVVRRLGPVEVISSGQAPIPYQVDGDYLGEARSLSLRHAPDALRLVFPTP